jgi:uncharacterized protein YidB (DUF937 family)
MVKRNWKILVMGLLVLSLAVAGVGFASAQGNGPNGGQARSMVQRAGQQVISVIADALGMEPADLVKEIRSGKSILKIADEKNVDKDKILQAAQDAEKERLQKLVDDGKITEDQMNWMLEKSKERLSNFLDRQGTGAIPGPKSETGKAVWSAVAEKLGMDADTLRCELRSKSLAAIAKEKGVDMDEIAKTMEDAYKQSIQKLVDDGKITQDQADAAIEQFNKHTEDCLSQGEGLGCGWGFQNGMRRARPFSNGQAFKGQPGRRGQRGQRPPAGPGGQYRPGMGQGNGMPANPGW